VGRPEEDRGTLLRKGGDSPDSSVRPGGEPISPVGQRVTRQDCPGLDGAQWTCFETGNDVYGGEARCQRRLPAGGRRTDANGCGRATLGPPWAERTAGFVHAERLGGVDGQLRRCDDSLGVKLRCENPASGVGGLRKTRKKRSTNAFEAEGGRAYGITRYARGDVLIRGVAGNEEVG